MKSQTGSGRAMGPFQNKCSMAHGLGTFSMESLLEEGAAGQPEATFFHAYNVRTLARKAGSLNRESGPPAQMTKTTIFWPMGFLQQTRMDRHGFHGRKQH